MDKSLDLVSTVISPLLLLLLAAGGVSAAQGEAETPSAVGAGINLVEEPDPQLSVEANAVPAEYDRQVEVLEQKGGSLGYNFLLRDGYAGRALEYGFLESSRSGGLFYRHMEKDSNLELDGFYLNENDYHGDLLLDYRGDYRLHLRTESLYHNLDRELLFSEPFTAFRNELQPNPTDPPLVADYLPAQQDSSATRYGVSVVQDRADFRYRLHNFPLHVNLGYWRYLKEGTVQQRFADMAFEGPLNTIYAQARGVDQQTQEGRFGLDAHLGAVDVIYDFRFRAFKDKLPAPVANYHGYQDPATGNIVRVGGAQQHNDNPDSSFISHTWKMHSALDGGLVAGASYSIEERENLSGLSDGIGSRHSKAYLQNAAGDFVYTPDPRYSLAVKYRRQEREHGNRSPELTSNVLKRPVDSTKDMVTASLSYKPRLNLSLVTEYRGEFLKRSNVSEVPSLTAWALPERSSTHTGSMALYYRPVKGLRSSAHLSYASTDHPSYGASFQNRREGKLLATYSRSNAWGVTAHAVFRRDENDEVEYFLVDFPFVPLNYLAHPLRSRDSRSENASIGVWVVPVPGLTVGGNYSYLHAKTGQPVLFTGVLVGSEAASEFTSRSHVYGLNASYAMSEKFDLSLMLQQIRSASAFKPQPADFNVVFFGSTTGVQQVSETDTVQNAISARGEYRFNSVLSTSLEYSLRNYDEKKSAQSAYNGTAHALLAVVAAKW